MRFAAGCRPEDVTALETDLRGGHGQRPIAAYMASLKEQYIKAIRAPGSAEDAADAAKAA